MFERLAIGLTALSQRVDRSRCRSSSTAPACAGKRCSSTSWAWASGPKTSRSSRRCSGPSRCSTSRPSAPRPTCSGSSSTRSATPSRPATSTTTSRWPAAPCPPGRSSVRSCRGRRTTTAARAGGPGVLDRHDDIPGWDLDLEQTFLVRVIVEGRPHSASTSPSATTRSGISTAPPAGSSRSP